MTPSEGAVPAPVRPEHGSFSAWTPLGFALRLVVLWSPMVGLLVIGPARAAIEGPLTRIYAVVASGALRLLGFEHARVGAILSSPDRSVAVEIEAVCTGYLFYWLFAAAVLAFPATWTARARGLIGGAALVFGLNLVRILSLYVLLGRRPDLFDEVHLVVWQSVAVLAIGLFWYAWAARQSSPAA